jgi:hypothetical protein
MSVTTSLLPIRPDQLRTGNPVDVRQRDPPIRVLAPPGNHRKEIFHDDAHAGPQHRAVVMQAGLPVQVRLPAGGWQVGFRTRPDGRTVVEVTDPDGALAGLVASATVSILSIDAGWAGWARDPGGGRRWWALAIGHAPPAADQPAVTFIRWTGRGRLKLPPQAVDGLWLLQDGLWVAAAIGHYTHVRLTAKSTTRVRRLQPSSR